MFESCRKSEFESVAERIEGDAQRVALSALQNCKPRGAAQAVAYSAFSYCFMIIPCRLAHPLCQGG